MCAAHGQLPSYFGTVWYLCYFMHSDCLTSPYWPEITDQVGSCFIDVDPSVWPFHLHKREYYHDILPSLICYFAHSDHVPSTHQPEITDWVDSHFINVNPGVRPFHLHKREHYYVALSPLICYFAHSDHVPSPHWPKITDWVGLCFIHVDLRVWPFHLHKREYCIILTLGSSHCRLPNEPNLFFVMVTTVLGWWT
jgi:hypothetical protein